MQELVVKIRNGYGINKLDHTFVFKGTVKNPHQNTNIVYAQNGTMKSSFAKVLRDYAKGTAIKDHIFNIPGSCDLRDESGNSIDPDQIFSIASFDNGEFESSKTASLLVSADLRRQYEEYSKQFDTAYETLLNRIKRVSRVSIREKHAEILERICSLYGDTIPRTPQGLLVLLNSIRPEIEEAPDFIQQMPFTVAGSKDAQKFADDNKGVINDLMVAYEEIKKSAAFVRGDFDSGNARKLVEIVGKTKFLDVDHELELLNKQTGDLEKVKTLEDLENKLATDVDKILANNPGLKKKFEKLIKDLSTDSRYELKKILEDEETKNVILLMENPTLYLRKLWHGYLKGCMDELDEVNEVQAAIKDEMEKIVEKAKKERTEWDKVVKKFNDRFRNLPYEIDIENRASVILEGVEEPKPVIRYKSPVLPEKLFSSDKERQSIRELLSTGERKALYLLNVMFEIEATEKSGKPCLVVLDDLVDSFDYKNKYAFLEYLYDVSKNYDQIKLILFTHNYDFFRLLQSRLYGTSFRKRSWFAIKAKLETELVEAEHFRVFGFMREHAETDKKMWISMIPFARNLTEYRCNDILSSTDYLKLTECLHSLDVEINVRDIKPILSSEIGITNSPFSDEEIFEDILIEEAEKIIVSPSPVINLYDNLILSMASRRLAENYMKSKMSQPDIDIAKMDNSAFTRKLFEAYTTNYTVDPDILEKLELVNLMTPEYIHVNSFMYEPLLDMSSEEISKLYTDLKNL